MQGFNKYYPPDYDSRENSSLNSYRGVHALGVRAKDIDKGILVVRFELPFNIWCGHCNAHIGAGVRYNAQKRKVGAYYSTPIFAFRCKCHLCSGWFEIRTDPQNARYVVEEGARAQAQDWEPEENGGYRAHDTEAPSASEPTTDAFSLLEKTTTQSTLALTKSQRLDSLFALSYRQTSDPYTMSQHLRARHRLEKRADQDQANADEAVVNKYGLPDHIPLARVDPSEGKSEWAVQATRSSSRKIPIPGDLSTTLRRNTVERYNPFDRGRGSSETIGKIGRGRGVVKVVSGGSGPKVARGVVPVAAPVDKSGGLVGLTGYESEEEDDEDAA